MLKILFISFIVLFSCVFNCAAQSEKLIEAGIGIPYTPIGRRAQIVAAFPNFSMKLINGKNGWRSGISYNFYPLLFGYRNYHYYIMNAGYERRLLDRKVKIFVGGDLGYLLQTSNWNNKYSIFYHYGIGPVFGGMYTPFPKIFIRTELAAFWGPSGYDLNGIALPTSMKKTSFTFYKGFSIEIGYIFKTKSKK